MLELVRAGWSHLRRPVLLALAAVGLFLSLACHSNKDRAPSITGQPANLTVTSGATASFTAAANGTPAPSFAWQRMVESTWTDIPGATTATYSFTATPADDTVQFRMVAANGSGTATSNAATLRVQHLSITTQPTAQVAVAPALATFAVVATGNPAPTYQWQRSNDGGTVWTDIASATGASYTTTATSATDNGAKFRVVVSNGVSAAVTSLAVALTVNVAPAITTQPASLTVTAPASADFTGAATGLPTPTTQWQRSNDGGTTWSDIAGATSATYSLAPTSASDNGAKFRLVASNGIGSAAPSASATLTMNAAPGISTQPASQTVVAPATGTFTVVATGLPAPSCQWQRSDDAGSTWANVSSGGTSATYTTAATAAADNGARFRVVLTNGIGAPATSSAATLTVNVAPSITTQPVGQTVTSPATASFTVAGTALPSPTIQWQRSNDGGTTWANVASGGTSTTYTTAATAASDNGAKFRAILSNGIGTAATSSAVTLTVNVAPAITTQPAPQTVTSPATATFTVAGTGLPTPTYQWQRSNDGGTTWADLTGATSASYTTTATSASDNNAKFRAVLSNGIGSSANSSAATLTVYAPPSVSNFSVSPTSVTSGSSATLSYTFTGASAKIGTSAEASDVAASVTSGGTTNVAPGTSTTYYLTVANEASVTTSATTTLTINPTITISGNAGVAGAILCYTDGTAKTATANGTGAYTLTVSFGWSGAVIPAMTGYIFSPIKRSFTNITANASTEDFAATAATSNWNSYAAGSYAGGDGSSGSPYLIATPEQLARLSMDASFDSTFSTGKYFTQVADLDLGAHQWVPVAEFRGTFDGGGYKTQNMIIDNAGGDYLGVFGKLNSGALVSNLGVTNASLNGHSYVGAVAGFASTATVFHCYSSGTIAGWGNLGGLVGAMDTAFDLSYSQSSCAVTGSAPNDQSYSGGLIGALWGGTTTINNCFATGTITGWENTGGLVGLTYHSGSLNMTNCYSTGNIITPRTGNWWGNVGGLVGVCASNVTLTNVYHSGTVTMLYPPDNAGKTGGIVGGNDGYPLSVNNGYYNSANASGQGGGTALTTADMRAAAFLIAINASQDPAPWVADVTGANQRFPMLMGLTGLTAPQLYVTNLGSNTMTVFGLMDQGNQAPARLLGGGNTGLNSPHSVALSNSELFIANHWGHNVTVFAKDASGDTAPIRTLQGAATGISNPVELVLQAGELFLTNYGNSTRVFDSSASGDVAPLRATSLPATSYGMCVNGDEVFLSRHPDTGDSNTVYVISRTASGAAAPLRTISGGNTLFNFVGGLAVADGELFVTNYFGSSVAVFDLTASGNVAPKRMISGALTSLGNPRAIRVYGGEVFVANQAGGDSILVFNVSDVGNVAPKRILKGAATGLSSPGGLLVQ